MLGALNMILLLIITAVIMINIILTQRRFDSIEQTVASRNFLDLAEFGKLNKEFKKNQSLIERLLGFIMEIGNY
jgi:hypothetical protein